jgi:hypothetical protein
MGLIPLGILSSAGSQLSGTYELIESKILDTATTSVTFTGLGAYSSIYKHLQIRMTMRTATSTGDFLIVKPNGSNLTHRHFLSGNGSTAISGASGSVFDFGSIPNSNSTANAYSATILDYLDAFSTTKNKTIRLFVGNQIAPVVSLASGLQVSTTATTSIELGLFNSTTFATGSRFSIYGIRG